MNHDAARRFWVWWFRWQRRGFDRSTAGYLAWQMAGMTDWLVKEYGYDAYCQYYAGGHRLPLDGYFRPRHNPDNPYCRWRQGSPLPLPG